MTQDTRKDPRAKIVSLNVRYKSATVDEFIENHSYDVSKGGVFIKTPNAFPPGTLLKFEIRIAGDKAVIVGVGRVVWKRDPTQGAPDRPAGMGVKFIKIDDSSRTLIDRLVATKADAGRAFDSEQPLAEGDPGYQTARGLGVAKPVETGNGGAAVPERRKTIVGVGDPSKLAAAGPDDEGDADLPAAVHKPPTRPGRGVGDQARGGAPAGEVVAARDPARRSKATLIGVAPDLAAMFPPAQGAAKSGGMFPTGDPQQPAGPAREQTVMKQAAELLEEALKETGGSVDEIGQNPLFAAGTTPTAAAPAASRDAYARPASVPPSTELAPAGSFPRSAPPMASPAEIVALATAPTEAAMPKQSAPPPPAPSVPPDPRLARAEADVAPPSARPSTRPSARPSPAVLSEFTSPPKRSYTGFILGAVLVFAAVGGAAIYKTSMGTGNLPVVVAPDPTPPTPAPSASVTDHASPGASSAPSNSLATPSSSAASLATTADASAAHGDAGRSASDAGAPSTVDAGTRGLGGAIPTTALSSAPAASASSPPKSSSRPRPRPRPPVDNGGTDAPKPEAPKPETKPDDSDNPY